MLKVILAAAAVTSGAFGQCDPHWLVGDGATEVKRVLCSVNWDPDGPGPEVSRPVIGGEFIVAGGNLVNCVAMWNGADWVPLGTAVADTKRGVTALLVTADGGLV